MLLRMLYEIKNLLYSRLIEIRQNPSGSFHAHVNWHVKDRPSTFDRHKNMVCEFNTLSEQKPKMIYFYLLFCETFSMFSAICL